MNLGPPSIRRPIPDDLAEQAARLGNRNALRAHYRTGSGTIERWLDESGVCVPITKKNPPHCCAVCGKQIKRGARTGMCQQHYRTALASLKTPPKSVKPKVFVADIVAHTAAAFAITIDYLKSKARSARVHRPRFAVCYLAREMTGLSFPLIAEKVGYRDHSSANHAYRKCQEYMATVPEYAAKVERIRQAVINRDPVPALVPEPEPEPKPAPRPTLMAGRDWWELNDDEFIAARIAEHKAAGGDFVEVYA